MRVQTTSIILFLLFPVLSSCQKKTEKEVEQETAAPALMPTLTEVRRQEILQQGGEASGSLLASLGPKLKAALKAGGPEHALMICQQIAQPSTKEVSQNMTGGMTGVTITRVSLKPRNPENAPDGLDTEVLTGWQKQVADDGKPPSDEVRVKDGKIAVFYRPILLQDVCLKCHGDPAAFSEALSDKLGKLYPDDKATGYTTGELRGAFRVEFPSETD